MNEGIVVVGSMNIDHVIRLARFPQPGETILGKDYRTFFGGKGANQAIAAARCGAHVTMIGKVGDDGAGLSIRQNLEANGVVTSWVKVDPQTTTGMAMILVEETGQNMIAVVGGANIRLSPSDIESAAVAIQEAKLLILQLEVPLETVATAIKIAKNCGAHVTLNPSPGQSLPLSLLTQTDSLILNETELALIEGETSVEIGAVRLAERSGARVIVTLGGEGVILCAPDFPLVHLPPHKVAVVDTVGAGDAFVGAYAVAVSEGRSFAEAAAWGNAAGALAVTKPGAQSALPCRDAILNNL
jgi:ribokinase